MCCHRATTKVSHSRCNISRSGLVIPVFFPFSRIILRTHPLKFGIFFESSYVVGHSVIILFRMNRATGLNIYTLVKRKTGKPYILWLVSNGWEQWDGILLLLLVMALKIGGFAAKIGLQMLKDPIMIG